MNIVFGRSMVTRSVIIVVLMSCQGASSGTLMDISYQEHRLLRRISCTQSIRTRMSIYSSWAAHCNATTFIGVDFSLQALHCLLIHC